MPAAALASSAPAWALNRRGCNRWVLLTRRYALKFPTLKCWRDFLFGLLNNQTEARVGTSGRAGVCPVLWHVPGGWLVVMPRVQILSDQQFRDFDAVAFAREHALCVEKKADSFGVLDGRVVAVDYGWDN